jgi:hypothetical protein
MERVGQTIVALVPLAITPVILWLLAEFGGTEKDVVWAIPWLVWSIAFAAVSIVLIVRPMPWHRKLARATGVASAVVVGLAVLLAIAGQLGVAGRF